MCFLISLAPRGQVSIEHAINILAKKDLHHSEAEGYLNH